MGLLKSGAIMQNEALHGMMQADDRQSALDVYNVKAKSDTDKSIMATAGSAAGVGLGMISEARRKKQKQAATDAEAGIKPVPATEADTGWFAPVTKVLSDIF